MPPLTDPDRLAAFMDALRNRKLTDFVEFRLTSTANRYVRRELDGIKQGELVELIYEHITSGGKLDEVVETRPEWCEEWEFHHDLRMTINHRLVYVEMRLKYRVPICADESSILVVNIHDA